MSLLLNKKSILFSFALVSLTAYADNENTPYYTVNGSKTAIISTNAKTYYQPLITDVESLSGIKTISLMRVTPSERLVAQNIENRRTIGESQSERDYSKGITSLSDSGGAVDLGMENVPVLDQGKYGTCVTFSSTAALDARFKLGDYIDQQCSLALDKGLDNDYWDGANVPSEVILPLQQYGFVQKGKCFNKVYPDKTETVLPKDYTTISDKTYSDKIDITFKKTTKTSLTAIKSALDNGSRVIMGLFLADIEGDSVSVGGFNTVIGDQQSKGGLWACKQPGNTVNYCPPPFLLNSGHEVVVIGYDDEQQLLKIRNSWGTTAGDKGNYYMTYAFFNSMSINYTVLN